MSSYSFKNKVTYKLFTYKSYIYIYIYIYIYDLLVNSLQVTLYIYSPTPLGLSSLANEVITLPLAFIARLFIY